MHAGVYITMTTLQSRHSYTPRPFPVDGNIIAPFWGDADISNEGSVSYEKITDNATLSRARKDIMYAFHNLDLSTFVPVYVFVATWDGVGYYSRGTVSNY